MRGKGGKAFARGSSRLKRQWRVMPRPRRLTPPIVCRRRCPSPVCTQDMAARAAVEKKKAEQAALEKERAAVQAALKLEREVQAGTRPFLSPSHARYLLSYPSCSLPTISPHLLATSSPFSALSDLTVTFPSTPIRSGPSGSRRRCSGSPESLERGDGLATPPPPSYPWLLSPLHNCSPPLSPFLVTSPRSHLPRLSLPRPPPAVDPQIHSPHTALTPTPQTPSPPSHTHHSSMPNHVTGRPPWPHQCQHERRPQEGPGPIGSGSR